MPMKKRSVRALAIMLLLPGVVALAAGGDVPDPWGPARFLLGSWTTAGTAKAEEGTGTASFSLELDANVIVRRNRVAFPPSEPGKAPAVHEDLLVIYPQGGGFRAIYFDNERHVIEYAVTFAGEAATFETANADGPRFRLLYRLLPDRTLASEFYIAPPGREFSLYLKGAARRVEPQSPASGERDGRR